MVAVILPTELVEHILSFLALAPFAPCRVEQQRDCNRDLCNAALVSKQWSDPARRALFGQLSISWRGGMSDKLLWTFNENPHFYGLVRHFCVCYTTEENWTDEWHETVEGDAASEEADRLFPDQTADLNDGETGMDHVDHVNQAADHSAELLGDRKWLVHDSDGRQEGSDIIWSLVARFNRLATLDAEDLDKPISADILHSLEPLLLRLSKVNFEAEHSEGLSIIPLLHTADVISLSAGGTGYRQRSPLKAPSDISLLPTNLRYLRMHHLDKNPLANLGLNLANLIGLDVPYLDKSGVRQVSKLLPALKSLKYLHLSDSKVPRIKFTAYDGIFSSIRLLSITHLQLNIFPSISQLRLLPSTIKELDLDCSFEDILPSKLGSIKSWKHLYLPALTELSLVSPVLRESNTPKWPKDVKDDLRHTEEFSVKIRESWEDSPKLPGAWWEKT